MKTLFIAAAAAVATLGVSVRADAQSVTTNPSAVQAPPPSEVVTPAAPPASEPPQRPLMRGLDVLGLGQPLRDANINVYGHAAASYTYNFRNSDVNAGRVFDIENEDLTFNQLDLTIERKVDLSQHRFDLGFRVEAIWGGDARFIHSNGLLDDHFATYALLPRRMGRMSNSI